MVGTPPLHDLACGEDGARHVAQRALAQQEREAAQAAERAACRAGEEEKVEEDTKEGWSSLLSSLARLEGRALPSKLAIF